MKRQIKTSFLFTLASTFGFGIIYPVLLAGIGLFVPSLPRPSLPTQPPQRAELFQRRPSMSGGPHSGASNLALTNPELGRQARERLKHFAKSFPPGAFPGTWVPRDLLFASASGYDPDLSVQGAMGQVLPIARAHDIPIDTVTLLVSRHTRPKLWGFIGANTVNVVELNQDLERLNAACILKKSIKD